MAKPVEEEEEEEETGDPIYFCRGDNSDIIPCDQRDEDTCKRILGCGEDSDGRCEPYYSLHVSQ